MMPAFVPLTRAKVFVISVKGAVGGVKLEVYTAVPTTVRKSAILPEYFEVASVVSSLVPILCQEKSRFVEFDPLPSRAPSI